MQCTTRVPRMINRVDEYNMTVFVAMSCHFRENVAIVFTSA